MDAGDATGSVDDDEVDREPPADGIVSIRGALVGLGFIWLTAVFLFGAMGAAVYAVTASTGYLLVAIAAAALAVAAGSASLRTFGYR